MKNEHVNKKEIIDKITPVIDSIVKNLGLILVEVDFVNESGRWVLRIFIYNDLQPISHKECEEVTKGLDDYLDELIPIHYYLEVSSPGLTRKIKSQKEYAIFKGKKVKIKLKQPIEGFTDRVISAKIIDYNPQKGLKIQTISPEKEVIIEENKISSIHLDLI